MGYMHIDNLYANQDILLFKQAYALEKIDGSSAHLAWKNDQLSVFSGGTKHETFVALFDIPALTAKFLELFPAQEVTVYGEAYGGKMQGMKDTYGPNLKFIVFDVLMGEDCWLSVPKAEKIALDLGLEFVAYTLVDTDLAILDKERDAFSVQAQRNGQGNDKLREGVVLRPLIEVRKNNGARIISKHKGEKFSETKTPRPVDPEFQKLLDGAEALAEEWVTPNRMSSVLGRFTEISVEKTGDVIKAMMEDVIRESKGEVQDTKENRKAIGKVTVKLFQEALKNQENKDGKV